MTCQLKIQPELLVKSAFIPYKYVVLTPKSISKGKRYEFLHEVNGNLNRYLQLSQEEYDEYKNNRSRFLVTEYAFIIIL